MDRTKAIRIFIGMLLVCLLGIGGYVRWRFIRNPATGGRTMGTTYSIRIAGRADRHELEILAARIESELAGISRQMSTWDPESEISRFNHATATNAFPVSVGFAEVVGRALALSKSTDGAFDPTLQPLLNLWGFGSEGAGHSVPSDEAVAVCKSAVGWHRIEVLHPPGLRKNAPEVSLALGAIAKGYGVDALARILEDAGYENWFVEIGGEVVVRGLNPSGVPWKIGIQYPSPIPGDDRWQGVLHLSRGAIATSGDYRNYLEKDGVIYSHILDPRTGKAVLSDTASVSVYAENCTDADGIATALFVMGPERGLQWVEARPGVEALFLVRDNGSIIEKKSSGFDSATGYIQAVMPGIPAKNLD